MPKKYQVWIIGFDKDQNITDYEQLVAEYKAPIPAISFAKDYVAKREYMNNTFPSDIKYIEVLVETVMVGKDYEENIDTIFSFSEEI